MALSDFPTLNAALNGTSALLLLIGWIFIKNKRVSAHRIMMSLALSCSSLFLVSYLYYHYHAGSKHFMGEGWIRSVYFTILISHTILAAAIVPLVLRTIWLAVKSDFVRHQKWARWTWPLWMYVSVTGVIIYWMLYEIY